MSTHTLAGRLLDVIEHDILPLTERGVADGNKVFGAAILRKSDLSLVIAIDTSASMDWGDPSKLVFAQRLAMALGYIGLVNHNRVSLAAFGGEGGLQ